MKLPKEITDKTNEKYSYNKMMTQRVKPTIEKEPSEQSEPKPLSTPQSTPPRKKEEKKTSFDFVVE